MTFLAKGKKDLLSMYNGPIKEGKLTADDAATHVDWTMNTFPNQDWQRWSVRSHRDAPHRFTAGTKTQLEHFASMVPQSPEIAGIRFDKSHRLDDGLGKFMDAESSYRNRLKLAAGDEGEKSLREMQRSHRYLDADTQVPEDAKILHDFGDGFAWWDLGVPSCRDEGNAMGHCGNTAANNGNVLSLRKRYRAEGKTFYKPHLTFIQHDDGTLGEMKGEGNEKPGKEFHPHIKELLKKGYLPGGGGHAPQNNFDISDLSHSDYQDVIQNGGHPGLRFIREGVLEPEAVPALMKTAVGAKAIALAKNLPNGEEVHHQLLDGVNHDHPVDSEDYDIPQYEDEFSYHGGYSPEITTSGIVYRTSPYESVHQRAMEDREYEHLLLNDNISNDTRLAIVRTGLVDDKLLGFTDDPYNSLIFERPDIQNALLEGGAEEQLAQHPALESETAQKILDAHSDDYDILRSLRDNESKSLTDEFQNEVQDRLAFHDIIGDYEGDDPEIESDIRAKVDGGEDWTFPLIAEKSNGMPEVQNAILDYVENHPDSPVSKATTLNLCRYSHDPGVVVRAFNLSGDNTGFHASVLGDRFVPVPSGPEKLRDSFGDEGDLILQNKLVDHLENGLRESIDNHNHMSNLYSFLIRGDILPDVQKRIAGLDSLRAKSDLARNELLTEEVTHRLLEDGLADEIAGNTLWPSAAMKIASGEYGPRPKALLARRPLKDESVIRALFEPEGRQSTSFSRELDVNRELARNPNTPSDIMLKLLDLGYGITALSGTAMKSPELQEPLIDWTLKKHPPKFNWTSNTMRREIPHILYRQVSDIQLTPGVQMKLATMETPTDMLEHLAKNTHLTPEVQKIIAERAEWDNPMYRTSLASSALSNLSGNPALTDEAKAIIESRLEAFQQAKDESRDPPPPLRKSGKVILAPEWLMADNYKH